MFLYYILQARWADTVLKVTRIVHVYTTYGVLKCWVFRRLCTGPNACECNWDEGKSMNLHLSSSQTAAGDEIGYMFQDRMLSKGGQTFTGFAEEMTKCYKRLNPKSRAFMNAGLFIKWWLGWASSHKIDFRVPCSECGDNPKMLAADGVGIGICLKKATYSPIEQCPDDAETMETLHKRNDRCFLAYNENSSDKDIRGARKNLEDVATQAAKGTELKLFKDQKEKIYFLDLLPKECKHDNFITCCVFV